MSTFISPAASGEAKPFLTWGNSSVGTTNNTLYLTPGWYASPGSTSQEWPLTAGAMTISWISFDRRVAGNSGGTRTFTLLVGGVASTVTLTVNNNAAATYAAIDPPLEIPSGSQLDMVCVTASSPTNSPTNPRISIGG